MTFPYRKAALSRLVGQFAEQPRIAGLIESMVEPIEALEADFDDLKTLRWIDAAQGEQLDGCGYIVGIERLARNDEDYRIAIKARVLGNTSSATPRDLIEGVRFLTDPTEIQYLESYPACALLFTDGKKVPAGSQAILQDIAPIAIENVPLMVSYGRAQPMRTGRLSQPAALRVVPEFGDTRRLQVNEGVLEVTSTNVEGGARLSGIAVSELTISANGSAIDAGIGLLAIGNHQVFDSGAHLPGVFQ